MGLDGPVLAFAPGLPFPFSDGPLLALSPGLPFKAPAEFVSEPPPENGALLDAGRETVLVPFAHLVL